MPELNIIHYITNLFNIISEIPGRESLGVIPRTDGVSHIVRPLGKGRLKRAFDTVSKSVKIASATVSFITIGTYEPGLSSVENIEHIIVSSINKKVTKKNIKPK